MYQKLHDSIKHHLADRELPIEQIEKCVHVFVQAGPVALVFDLEGHLLYNVEEQVTEREEYDAIIFNHRDYEDQV
jgi:hypothetical protein